jgi:hypothetical protein
VVVLPAGVWQWVGERLASLLWTSVLSRNDGGPSLFPLSSHALVAGLAEYDRASLGSRAAERVSLGVIKKEKSGIAITVTAHRPECPSQNSPALDQPVIPQTWAETQTLP